MKRRATRRAIAVSTKTRTMRTDPPAAVGPAPQSSEFANECDAEDDLDLWDAFALLGDVGNRDV